MIITFIEKKRTNSALCEFVLFCGADWTKFELFGRGSHNYHVIINVQKSSELSTLLRHSSNKTNEI